MNWNTKKIFISSTFNDMHAERDYIKTRVIPWINEDLKSYNTSIQVTDLRWGINTESLSESEQERKVLHVCLDTIMNTRPYFVTLLGDRYGWMPPKNNVELLKQQLGDIGEATLNSFDGPLSVTTMELLLGAIGMKSLLPHSFFFFRKKDSYTSIPNDKLSVYCEKEGTVAYNQLAKLKERIKQFCNQNSSSDSIFEYSTRWDPEKEKMIDLDDFGKKLHDAILNDIINNEHKNEDNSSINEERKAMETFVAINSNNFYGRTQLIDKLKQFFLIRCDKSYIHTEKMGLILTGTSGSGKSYVFSKICRELIECADEHSLLVLYHVAGISSRSVYVNQMLYDFCRQISNLLSVEFNETDTNIKNVFKKLILKAQAHGLFPVVLIDSLDSFLADQINDVINCISYGIPFLCTSLPIEKNLIKKRKEIVEMSLDTFELEDAKSLINAILTSNVKELSEEHLELLLSKYDDNGNHAYSSPLWLSMTLSLLLELGADDFRQIHAIQVDKDDKKISEYLRTVIEKMPSSPDKLFSLYIEMGCQYFNPKMTKESLTYMALTNYGIEERQLAILLGNDWDSLEFNSLRFWLKNFIKRYGTDKWTLSHNILKDVILNFKGQDIISYNKKLYNVIIHDALEGRQDINEFLSMIIVNSEYGILHKYLETTDSKKDIMEAIGKAIYTDQTTILTFILNYWKLYHQENIFYTTNYFVVATAQKIAWGCGKDMIDKSVCIEFYDNLLRAYTQEELTNADKRILSDYYILSSEYMDFLYENELFDISEVQIQKQKELFYHNKTIRSEEFLTEDYVRGFFSSWNTFVFMLYCNAKFNDSIVPIYKNEFCELIREQNAFVQYFNDKNDVNDIILSVYDYLEYYLGRYSVSMLGRDFLVDKAKEIHTIFANIRIDEDAPEYIRKKYEDEARTLVKYYVCMFDDEYPTTDLIANGFTYKEPEITISKEQNYENERSINVVGKIDETDDADQDICINIEDIDELLANARQTKYQHEMPLINDIEEAEKELEIFLDNNTLNDYESEKNDNIIINCYFRIKNIAEKYLELGQKEKAIDKMKVGVTIAKNFIYKGWKNYNFGNKFSDCFIDISNWYGTNVGHIEQIAILESLCFSLWQNYFHHYNSDSVIRIFLHLKNLYHEYGNIEQEIRITERMFSLSSTSFLDTAYDYYDFCYKDICYIRTIYKDLINLYQSQNRITDAVVTIERWLEICDKIYVDDDDNGYAYNDYDEAYDKLASLYDGTRKIVEGMVERNSVFLKDRYILVNKDDKWGYISHKGEIVIPCIYERAWRAMDGDLLSVCKNDHWGYITVDGQCPFGFHLDTAFPIQEGTVLISANDKWAFMQQGSLTPINVPVNRFFFIHEGLQKIGLFYSGSMHLDYLLPDGITILFSGKIYKVYNVNHGVIVTQNYDENGDSYAAIYTTKGENVTSKKYSYIAPFGENILTPFQRDGNTGFIERNGKEKIAPVFHFARPFSGGLAAVSKYQISYTDSLWGFIDQEGREIVPSIYCSVGDFHEDLAWVCQGKNGVRRGIKGCKFGFINTSGELIIPLIFDDAASFANGKALVFKDGEMFYIDHNGNRYH